MSPLLMTRVHEGNDVMDHCDLAHSTALHDTAFVFQEAMKDEKSQSEATSWPPIHYTMQHCPPASQQSCSTGVQAAVWQQRT